MHTSGVGARSRDLLSIEMVELPEGVLDPSAFLLLDSTHHNLLDDCRNLLPFPLQLSIPFLDASWNRSPDCLHLSLYDLI